MAKRIKWQTTIIFKHVIKLRVECPIGFSDGTYEMLCIFLRKQPFFLQQQITTFSEMFIQYLTVDSKFYEGTFK